jgi:Gpi18-like mannosyltransferase
MERRFGKLAARWTMVVMAFQPYALFTGVVYTESLFMMLTVAALILFDRGLYPYAAVCGALASATRFVGVMLLPGMLFAWILQRRPASAAIAAIVSSTGAFAYIVFLHVHFGDALAFIHAENAWKANSRAAQTITHPPKFRSFLKAVMLGGACVLFVWSRKKFPTIFIAYAVAALLLILCSGQYFSADRYVYGIIVFSMALGLLFSHHRKWGYAAVFASVLVLCFFSASFAVGLFVG